MARYWRGGTGNWTDTSKWSDTDGGSGGFSAPTSSDDVYFTLLSHNATYIVSIDNNGACNNLDIRLPSSGVMILKQTTAGQKSLTIYGNIYTASGVSLSGVTGSQTNGLILRGNTQGRTITTNGVLFPSTTFYDGAGYVLQDTFNHVPTTSTMLMFNGTLDTNEQICNWRNFQSSTGPLNLDFTNSVITLTGEWINQAGNITLVSAGSEISCRGRWFSGNALGGGKCTYNKVTINPSAGVTSAPAIDGGNFYDLTMYGYHLGTFNVGMAVAGNIVVDNNCILQGAGQANRMLLLSSVSTTQRTITCNGTITAEYVDIQDMLFDGTADLDLSTSEYVGDAQGNSGLIFPASKTIYIKSLSSSTIWHQDNIWFSDEACTIPTRIPLPQDDVMTVPTSFVSTANRSITCGRNRLCRNLDLSVATYPPKFNRSTELYLYGSFKGCPTTGTGSQIMYFAGRDTYTIDPNGMTMPWTDNIICPYGGYDLLSEYKSTGAPLFGIRQGTFISNGYEMDIQLLSLSLRVGSTGIPLMSDMKNSLIKLRGYGSTLTTAPTGGITTIDMAGSTLEALNTATGTMNFGTNYVFGNVKISSSADLSLIYVTTVTINKLILANQGNCILKLNNVYTFKYNEMIGGGKPDKSLTIQNTALTTQARLDKQTAGNVVLNYVKIKNINSLDLNTIYAVNSTDLGNNLNITFGQDKVYRKADMFQIL